MQALVLSCTLKKSPAPSNTEKLAQVIIDQFEAAQCKAELIRVVDKHIEPGVESTALSQQDDWPAIHTKILASNILVIATPTWVGHPSSLAQAVIERMDGLLSETDKNGTPVAYNKVAGVVVTGNEDGAHHVISEVSGGLIDLGFTIPGQAWTYWNKGPGPGKDYSETQEGHTWSKETGETAAQNLLAVARALVANPIK